MYILGISCYYHDSAAVLLKDGQLIAASEEERFSRIKHDFSFPKQSIHFCLRKAGIRPEDLSYVVFYEKPFLKFQRVFLNAFNFFPKTREFFIESMKKYFFDSLWIKSHIVNELQVSPKKILFSEHHLSHAASAFFCSPFQKAAILTIDGVGEWATVTWGVGEGNKITLKEEIRFPHSLGLLYSVFTVFAGFEANEGEYKLMGLAPYGKPLYVEKVRKLLDIASDGSFSMLLDNFSYHYSLRSVYTKKFEKLFGQPNLTPDKVAIYYADIASSIQYVLEEILLKIATYVKKQTNLNLLCYAGGVALNGVANWRIAQSSLFKDIYIQPAAGDSGGALGAALWAYHTVLGNKRNFVMNNVYYGDEQGDHEIKNYLDKENIPYKKMNEDSLIEKVVQRLDKGEVVGWVQGEFEWGPRALGHRSILADPRKKSMREMINSKIKFREAFRPFAPSILAEKGNEYFLTDKKEKQYPFKFMQYVLPVKNKERKHLGAITHIDGTSRPQFVEKKINPKYYNLIKSFGKKTSIPILLNTSFNLKGEPIVNTPAEAVSTFKRSGIDILVINNFMLTK